MTTAFRRLIRLQRKILETIRADVRRAMGPQSRDLRRYYEAYKREFRGQPRHSTKEELLKSCARADLILMGDYHTFPQSQKAALRVLRELLNWELKLALGLELVPAIHQPELEAYLKDQISEQEFLQRIQYQTNWGFHWEQFRPLLALAREHQLPVIALNQDSKRLDVRDAKAAELMAEFTLAHPKRKLFVLYGDLHLARGHIPRRLKSELSRRGLRRKTLLIFQNSEALYWKLAAGLATHAVDVLRLGPDRFCIMNAAPWVKLQSYLDWVEHSSLLNLPESSHSDDWHEDAALPNLHEIAHERLRQLAEALRLELPVALDFTIQTVNDLSFLNTSTALRELPRPQLKAVKYSVLLNRTTVVPGSNMIYLSSPGVNALCEGVSLLLHYAASGSRLICHDPREHFYSAVLSATLGYFGSKILNHKRKCDLEDDFRLRLEQKLPRGALPGERLQRSVDRLVLRHCQAQREYARSGRYRSPAAPRGQGRISKFLETARSLGGILGEKLYVSYAEGRFSSEKLETLFRAKLEDTRAARGFYLLLIEELERAPLAHTSKLDLF